MGIDADTDMATAAGMGAETSDTVRYGVYGMDCAHDVADVERAARGVPGIAGAAVSLTAQAMTLQVADPSALPSVERAVEGLGYRVARLAEGENTATAAAAARAGLTPGYRRALAIVVALNLGYGIVEMAGGVLSGSQAVRADALDFLGDGLISLLGLVAFGWAAVWRARTALAQGMFLGAMGLGVLAVTAYRVVVQRQPEAELMGVFGVAAMAVNLAAALALMPHRAGDANMRAVWLFTRNDAIGNLAVVVAAGLVAVTASPWPDLAVAFAIAGLFLHSAWRIVRDARTELAAAR